MPIANVVEAALAFITMAGAVRALVSIRLRCAGRSVPEVHDVAKAIAVAVVLAFAPATQASAADPAPQRAPDAHQRPAAMPAPYVDLEVLGDALKLDANRFARPDDTARTLVPQSGARAAAGGELDNLTAATLEENAVHGAVAFAPPWDDGLGGDVPAAEAELHVLLPRQK